jgi:integrase/recombinase XerC
MRLYKRGKTWWVAFGADRISTKCTDKEAAERWARLEQRRRADPAHAAAEAATISTGIRTLRAEHERRGRAAATLTYYSQKLGHIARAFGPDAPMSSITAPTVDEFITTRRAEGVSAPELAKELGALRAMLRQARRAGLYHLDPVAVLPVAWEQGYVPRQTWLTPAEAAALVEHLGPERAPAVLFALATGARRSEVQRAQREDLDMRAGLVRLRGQKTKRAARVVPVLGFLRPLLERVLADAPGKRGEPLFDRWQNARRDIHAACVRAGVPNVTWNDLRRSHAKWLRGRGVEPALIAELLGHASSRMAEQVYGKPSPEQLAKLLSERTRGEP